jgi:hypothetical protein
MDAVYIERLLNYKEKTIIPDATIEINPVFNFLIDIQTSQGIEKLVENYLLEYRGKITEVESGNYTRHRDSFESVSGKKLSIDIPHHPEYDQMFMLLTDGMYEETKTHYHTNRLQLQDRLVHCYAFKERHTVSDSVSSRQLFGITLD